MKRKNKTATTKLICATSQMLDVNEKKTFTFSHNSSHNNFPPFFFPWKPKRSKRKAINKFGLRCFFLQTNTANLRFSFSICFNHIFENMFQTLANLFMRWHTTPKGYYVGCPLCKAQLRPSSVRHHLKYQMCPKMKEYSPEKRATVYGTFCSSRPSSSRRHLQSVTLAEEEARPRPTAQEMVAGNILRLLKFRKLEAANAMPTI